MEVDVKTRTMQVQEGIKRLRMLGVLESVVKDFEEGRVQYTEPYGALYWLTDEMKEHVREWEEKSGAVVYHVCRSFTEFGELLSLLYVSPDVEEWEVDKEYLKREGYVYTYCVNVDDPWCSESGGILVKGFVGGIRRIS